MRNVVVTGSGKGIGFEITKKLIQEGFHVFGVTSSIETNQKNIECYSNEEFTPIGFDLRSYKNLTLLLKEMPAQIYAIINNAGICKVENLGGGEDVWEDVLAVNLHSVFYLTNALIGRMQRPGRIINISSQLGVEGRRGYSAYCATKFALNGLTKVWAKELGKDEITVNSICPGWVETEMTIKDVYRIANEAGANYEKVYAEICSPLELQRMNTAEEIANLVSFLLSQQARGITGRDLLLQTVWNNL